MSANIRAFRMHAAPALGVTALQLHTVEMQFTGETALETGRAVLATTSGEMVIKYVVAWKHEGGFRKWDIDIRNAASA